MDGAARPRGGHDAEEPASVSLTALAAYLPAYLVPTHPTDSRTHSLAARC